MIFYNLNRMKLAIASDHAGYDTKEVLKDYLVEKGHNVFDFGPDSDASMDYADTAHPLALAVENKEFDFGIVLCGSGNGINITANKHQGIRSALCWIPEIATLGRQHNDANICSMPARYISAETAKEIVDAFLSAEFEGGRHQRRIEKIPVK